MSPKDSYTGKDFTRHARRNFPEEFAIFQDVYKCNLEHKTYLNENHTAHGIRALFVGNYHTRVGGAPVWAEATTNGVRYFSGKVTESVCVPILEHQVSRIYYAAPYDTVLGAQDGASRTAGRKAGHYFVEMIIKILFLLAGQIAQVDNLGQTDMLGKFEYVCVHCVHKPEVQEVSHVPPRQSVIVPPQGASGRENKKRKGTSDDHDQRIKQEDMDDVQPTQQGSHSPMPYRLASDIPQTSLFDQLRRYEAEMESTRAREKQAHVEEITRLQDELAKQEQKARVAEEKATKERKRRKGAEERVESLQGQNADLQAQNAALREQPADSGVEELAMPNKQKRGLKQEVKHLQLSLTERNRTIRNLRDQFAEKREPTKKKQRPDREQRAQERRWVKNEQL